MVPVEAVTDVDVTSEVEADWRGLAGYLVKFQIQNVLKLTVREPGIPRAVEEFSTLDSQIRLKFPFSVPDSLVLPETFSINSLNACINVFMTTDTLRIFQLFEDFATMNYKDCFEVKWSKDMTTLPTVFEVCSKVVELCVAVLSIQLFVKNVDECMLLDNEALYDICFRTLPSCCLKRRWNPEG